MAQTIFGLHLQSYQKKVETVAKIFPCTQSQDLAAEIAG